MQGNDDLFIRDDSPLEEESSVYFSNPLAQNLKVGVQDYSVVPSYFPTPTQVLNTTVLTLHVCQNCGSVVPDDFIAKQLHTTFHQKLGG